MRSRTGRLLAAAGAVGVVHGVEVGYCVGNPNANIVTDVPGVNVKFDLGLGFGFGF